jgi:heme exporter protein C
MWPDWLLRLGSPPAFFAFARALTPWLAAGSALLIGYGVFAGLALSPPDYQQGEAVRIIYVHVPAAWLSLFGYSVMAVAAVVALIWRIKLAECVVIACAPVGASFTALALFTGMLWGKPMWGTYWQWGDARLVSELVLLFLYLGAIGLYQAFNDPRAGARACALLVIVGVVNVPIVHYSVQWWNTLHQGPSVLRAGGPSIHPSMLWPLLSMALGSTLFAMYAVLRRTQNELLARERGNPWVKDVLA